MDVILLFHAAFSNQRSVLLEPLHVVFPVGMELALTVDDFFPFVLFSGLQFIRAVFIKTDAFIHLDIKLIQEAGAVSQFDQNIIDIHRVVQRFDHRLLQR